MARRYLSCNGTTPEKSDRNPPGAVGAHLYDAIGVVTATEDGDTVTVPITFGGNEDKITLKLIDDEWNVDEQAAAARCAPGSPARGPSRPS